MSKIEFIIPTYDRSELLYTIVCSILSQTNPNWTIHIVGDNVPQKNLDLVNSFLMFINDDRIKFTNLPECNSDWGHTPRNYGLDHAQEEWIVMTGEDNYYVPTFVDNFLQVGETGKDLVYCDLVHDMKRDDYQPIKSRIAEGYIDIGNFMTRRSIIGDLRLITSSYQADFKFVNYINKYKTGKVGKIDKILYVHN